MWSSILFNNVIPLQVTLEVTNSHEEFNLKRPTDKVFKGVSSFYNGLSIGKFFEFTEMIISLGILS